ncbi:DUF4386 domain-containing protein [Mameliella alba]|uniref:DUF4386 domain-containing protein n=1 Tax=Mameliella alba TaxID=561184 RepID=UPI000B5302E4|nr:DUF4386 domain-containing protein [Mameliella alba]OWV43280.1 hypothetical protein CDZ95_10850 [Mameliella alba]OWV68417.1 hypothetical protein CDZ97_01205 [Mameliella alba]
MQALAPSPVHVRTAGALYLVIILCGLTAEIALRGPLLAGSPQEIAAAIGANLPQFRLSLLADVVMLLADIALALLFFAMLRDRAEGLARAAMVFRLGQAVLIGASLIALASAPALLADLPRMAVHMTEMHALGYDIGLILFGVTSLLMARLLSLGATPRIIALGIAAAGLVYLTGSLLRLAAPLLSEAFQPAYLVCILAESALCLWLLITGKV